MVSEKKLLFNLRIEFIIQSLKNYLEKLGVVPIFNWILCYVIYKTMCIFIKYFNLCIIFNHNSLILNNIKCIHSIRFFLYYDATN